MSTRGEWKRRWDSRHKLPTGNKSGFGTEVKGYEKTRMQELRDEGYTVEEISEIVGRSYNTVSRYTCKRSRS